MKPYDLIVVILLNTVLCFLAYKLYVWLIEAFYEKRNLKHAINYGPAATSIRSVPCPNLIETFVIIGVLIPVWLILSYVLYTYTKDIKLMLSATVIELRVEKVRNKSTHKGSLKQCLVKNSDRSRYLSCPEKTAVGTPLTVYFNDQQKPYFISYDPFKNHSASLIFPLLFFLGFLICFLLKDILKSRRIIKYGKSEKLDILSTFQFEIRGTTTIRMFTRWQDKNYYIDCIASSWFKAIKLDERVFQSHVKVWILDNEMAHKGQAAESIENFENILSKP